MAKNTFKTILALLFVSAFSKSLNAGIAHLYSFDAANEFEISSSKEVKPGAFLKFMQYSNNPKNIYKGDGSALISYRSNLKTGGKWIFATDELEDMEVSGFSFAVKGIYGNEEFEYGVKDSKGKMVVCRVIIKNKDWNVISHDLKNEEIEKTGIEEFYISFDTSASSANIFIDELVFNGGPAAGKEVVKEKITPETASSEEIEKQESAPLREKSIAYMKPLVRSFDRSPSDLQAVHDMLMDRAQNDPRTSSELSDKEFMDLIQRKLFLFFWYEVNPENGVSLDRGKAMEVTDHSVGSNASVGFMLSAMCIGHSRGWITYDQAYDRVLTALKFHRDVSENVHGFFYHFVDLEGKRVWECELSTIDTTLFIAGIITAMEYFKGTEIEKVGNDIFLRVDWRWAHDPAPGGTFGGKFAAMGWTPKGWQADGWNRYCEGLLLSVMELAHPTANISNQVWFDVMKPKGGYSGYEGVSNTGPLFTFQYHGCYIDFRDKNDGWANHFELTLNHTLANRQYCIDIMNERKGFGPNSWGLTACDHPDGYHPFGAPPGPPGDNGTIAPTAPGGSFAQTPYFSLKAFRYMYDTWRDRIWGKYAFVDAYNIDRNWFAPDNIGIDQGAMLTAIENHRTGMIWKYFMQNRYIQDAMRKIGFRDEPRATAKVLPKDLSGEDWLLKFGNNRKWYDPKFDDSMWQKVYVPDRWENQLVKEYDGVGWYRKHFTVSQKEIDEWGKRNIFLHIGGIDDIDETYLNGKRIGATAGWNTTRSYKVDSKILKVGEDNVLAIKVIDNSGGGGVWFRPVEIGPFIPNEWRPFYKP